MAETPLETAEWLIDGAKRAREAGDDVMSMVFAVKAAEFLCLAKALGYDVNTTKEPQE